MKYDCVIVGGGIVGIGLFRDLTLHGVKTLLIDRGDFTSQTSSRSSKMLHGGIRYLKNLDFSLIREALNEKRIWANLTPHLVQQVHFAFPLFKESKTSPWQLKLGLFLYDLLSGFSHPKRGFLSKEETLAWAKELNAEQLLGAGLYSDAIMDDAQLGLDCLYDGLLTPYGDALNYCTLKKASFFPDGAELLCEQAHNQTPLKIECQEVAFCLGPFTDQVLPQVAFPHWKEKLLPTKGIHLWLDKDRLHLKGPLVYQANDERVIFVIPQKEKILVGTTEAPISGNFFNLEATDTDVNYLLETLNYFFPHSKIVHADILGTFAGVRPLVKEGQESDAHHTSREHAEFFPHPRASVIAGGKYTTFRSMVQPTAERICRKLHLPYNPQKTLQPLKAQSHFSYFSQKEMGIQAVKDILDKERPKNLEDFFLRRLGLPYLGPNHFVQRNIKLFQETRPIFEQKLETFDAHLWDKMLNPLPAHKNA